MKKTIISFVLFSLLTTSFVYNESKSSCLRIVLFRDHDLRPVSISEREFWSENQFHDTLEVTSGRLIKLLHNKIQNFSYEDNSQISNRVAFIFKNKQNRDTFYTDEFFLFWRHKGKTYRDTTGFFNKAFRHILIAGSNLE
jgi:hypothetical protein